MNLLNLSVQLLEICRNASDAIKAVYFSERAMDVSYKADNSPITEADRQAHEIIVSALSRLTPLLPVLSEEQEIPPFALRRQWSSYWLVDPLDGTKEFIDRTGEFTVNIALIDNGVPVLGIVYVPLEECGYVGINNADAINANSDACNDSSGAWRFDKNGKTAIGVGGVPRETIRVLTSSRHRSAGLDLCIDSLRRQFTTLERIKAGSALKFCRLAEGNGDIYPRFSPCSEWDTAAGHALLVAAGGELLTTDLKPFYYNRKESLINPHFYALGGKLEQWQRYLA